MDWRLARIDDGRPALVVGDYVRPLPDETLVELLADPVRCATLAAWRDGWQPLADSTLLSPLPPQTTLYLAGANYVDHVLEMVGRPPPPKDGSAPFFFMKPGPTSIVGPDATVALPHAGVELDWEAEIAVVIGCRARHVAVADAMAHVAGYTIVNDLSARDLMKRSDVVFAYDWIGQKCFPGSLPMGPWITPTAAVADPHRLTIRLWVDDELWQNSSSVQMHWSIAEQIAALSARVELFPGDLIATGTPAGCGRPKARYLRAGETTRIEIEALGSLTTHFVAPVEASVAA